MREILFRGKMQGLTDWCIGYYARHNDEHFILLDIDDEENFTFVNSETVGQYTGLLDKNGEKIFEGDIVRIYDSNIDDEENFVLKYDTKQAVFYMESNSLYITFDNVYAYQVEVIGNIYDNPDLLEVGNDSSKESSDEITIEQLDFAKTIDFEVLGDIKPTIIEILGSYDTVMIGDCTLHLKGTQLELPAFWKYLTYSGWLSQDRAVDKKIISELYQKGLIKIHEIRG